MAINLRINFEISRKIRNFAARKRFIAKKQINIQL